MTPFRILILEDTRSRVESFHEAASVVLGDLPDGYSIAVEPTARGCIERLREGNWDAAFLDHDLNGEAMVPAGTPGHGMDVVRWVMAEPHRRRLARRWIMHSFNDDARGMMCASLPGSVSLPGAWGKKKFRQALGLPDDPNGDE